jgi:hypothetical protein
MTDKRPVFDTPVSAIHIVLSRNFIMYLNTLIFFPSAISLLKRQYTSNKPHICKPTLFPSLKDLYATVILFCN